MDVSTNCRSGFWCQNLDELVVSDGPARTGRGADWNVAEWPGLERRSGLEVLGSETVLVSETILVSEIVLEASRSGNDVSVRNSDEDNEE